MVGELLRFIRRSSCGVGQVCLMVEKLVAGGGVVEPARHCITALRHFDDVVDVCTAVDISPDMVS